MLKQLNLNVVEMPHHGQFSFCCGAGGAQMWKEEEEGEERVSMHRFQEAVATQADTLAVGCPFCLTMFNDAAHDANSSLQTMDIAELVAQSLA